MDERCRLEHPNLGNFSTKFKSTNLPQQDKSLGICCVFTLCTRLIFSPEKFQFYQQVQSLGQSFKFGHCFIIIETAV